MFAKVIASLEWNVRLSGLQLCNTAPRSPVQGRLYWVLILPSRGFSTSMFHVVLVFNRHFFCSIGNEVDISIKLEMQQWSLGPSECSKVGSS